MVNQRVKSKEGILNRGNKIQKTMTKPVAAYHSKNILIAVIDEADLQFEKFFKICFEID